MKPEIGTNDAGIFLPESLNQQNVCPLLDYLISLKTNFDEKLITGYDIRMCLASFVFPSFQIPTQYDTRMDQKYSLARPLYHGSVARVPLLSMP